MALSILNNIASLMASNQLSITNANLQDTLYRLSSGSKINSGADDAAGLAIANGLEANITALTQSASNATSGIGALQVADGALSEVTDLLNRAVTLATEAANGTLTDDERTAIQEEFAQIQEEIDSIGTTTTFNGTSVFSSNATSIFMSDGVSSTTIAVTTGTLSASGLGLSSSITLSTASDAQTALTAITAAISSVAATRGSVGASINRLEAAVSVQNVEIQNLTSAEDDITAADIAEEVTNLNEYNILEQTGIAALAQANSTQQAVLKLLQ